MTQYAWFPPPRLETAVVIEVRKGEPGGRELDSLIHKADAVAVPVDADQMTEARRRTGASAGDATPPA